MSKVFIVIPAYNEQDNIVKLLTDIKNLQLAGSKKIIVVDDGSTDTTQALAERFLSELDLQIIVHPKNLGVPQTFYDGLYAASHEASPEDVIVIIEGDNTSDLQLIPRMVDEIAQGTDIVIASRHVRGGAYKNFSLYRKYGSFAINIILKIFFHIKGVSDYTIFYRAYSAKVIQDAFQKYEDKFITTKSFAANLEILLKAGEFAKNCKEVALVYDYGLKKGKSKMKITKALLEYKDLIIKNFLGKL